ncbi:hypothetical protein [Marinicella rhabdoformis]|uniref:hypothetical protein n=1 Tax=Marinicella rhabdoformis TaxID=2580566 RepID=UPI0012AED8CB|nr:hypothetical protein [Marinicella rhabdoformis]
MKQQIKAVIPVTRNCMHTLILSIMLFSLVCVASAEGSETTYSPSKNGQLLSLSETLKRILQNNPELKGFEFLKKQWQGQKETAELKPELRLNIGADNVFGTTPYTGISQSEFSLSLSSVIETGKKDIGAASSLNNKFKSVNSVSNWPL